MQNTNNIELFVRVGMMISIDPAKIDDKDHILEAIRNGVIDGETYKPDAFFDEEGGIGEKEWAFDCQPLVVEKQSQSDTKHEAKIVFGEQPSILDEFSFDTEAELLSFYRGLEAMNGWNDYRHIENLEADDYEHMRDEVPELYEEVCALTGMKLCSECDGLFPASDLDDEGLCPDCLGGEQEDEKPCNGDSREHRIYNEAFLLGIVEEVIGEIELWHGGEEHLDVHEDCEIYQAIQNGVSEAELIELAYEVDSDLFDKWKFTGGVDIVPIEEFGCYAARYDGIYYCAPMHVGGAFLFDEFGEADMPEDGFADAVDVALEALKENK